MGRESAEIVTAHKGELSSMPDIYYIILDGYASSKMLKDVFGYDNSEFIDYLAAKGFYIAAESRSNYTQTFVSLASSLNMEYVNYIADFVDVERTSGSIPYLLVHNNKVVRFLKKNGYKFVHFGTAWGSTMHNKYADIEFQSGKGNEFYMMLVKTTMLKWFEKSFLTDDVRKRILDNFVILSRLHRIPGPKFVFAHIISPHPPYLFDKNGNPVPGEEPYMDRERENDWLKKEKYINQLIYINKKIKIFVDEILSKSPVRPVIILQSDHGTAFRFGLRDAGWYERWENPKNDMIEERMRIFNANYLPDGEEDLLYESITPVNTFRIIFNGYFDAGYELLGDRCYYSSYKRPFKFIEVDDSIFLESKP